MSLDPARILVVDDDPVTCELLCEVFQRHEFDARYEQTVESALLAMREMAPDVLVSDIRMKTRVDGLALLEHVRREFPAVPVVLMTAFGSVETAVRAVKAGAFDYISKPFKMDVVVRTVRRALSARAPATPVDLEEDADDHQFSSGLIGRDPAMLEIYKVVAHVSDSRAAVLITGESGTGKELIARAIHTHGKRAAAPFVAVNCGALTETLLESELFGHARGSFTGAIANKRGIFEQAGAGTVFLDEISETSPALQVKLLRVLQEREVVPVGGNQVIKVNARTIAASNSDLEGLCDSGAFRRDLFYRLNVINIHVPPLRERRDDIPLLVTHFLWKHTPADQTPPAVDSQALQRLIAYLWPGNVRELENVIERAITLNQSGLITSEDLPPRVCGENGRGPTDASPADDLGALFAGWPTIDEIERRYLLRVLEATGGNRTRTAEIIGISRRTLYRMADRFQLDI
jgi:two-component system, NtrC family, response regulator AtoC